MPSHRGTEPISGSKRTASQDSTLQPRLASAPGKSLVYTELASSYQPSFAEYSVFWSRTPLGP